MKMPTQAYNGSYIKGNLGGVKVSNPSLVKYYGEKIIQNACPLQKQERCPKVNVRVP